MPEKLKDRFDKPEDLPLIGAVLPSRGGEPLIRQLFEPLGYSVEMARIPLDVNRQAGSIPIGAATPCFDGRGPQNPWSMFNAGSH
jgi:hypothetical protein